MQRKDSETDLIAKRQEQLGQRLKQLRIQKGYSSYEQFAFEHGIGRAQYGRYEKGANISFSTLCKILIALDISLEEFFKEGFQ